MPDGNLTWKINLFLGRFYVSDAFRDLTYSNPYLAYSYFNLSAGEAAFLSTFIAENRSDLEEFSDGLIFKRKSTMTKFPITTRLMGEGKLFVFFKLYCGMFPKDYFLEETVNDAISFGRYCEHIFAHYPNIHPVFSDLIRYERRAIKANVIKEDDAVYCGDEVPADPLDLLFEFPAHYRLSPQYKWIDSFDFDLLLLIESGTLPDHETPTYLLLDRDRKINTLTKDMFDLIFFLSQSANFFKAKELIQNTFGLEDAQLRKYVESLIEKNLFRVLSKGRDYANV
jgi:hypothetical protein